MRYLEEYEKKETIKMFLKYKKEVRSQFSLYIYIINFLKFVCLTTKKNYQLVFNKSFFVS